MAVVAGLVLADGHHGHHGISLPSIPLPTVHLDTSGLLALLKRPPIPVSSLTPSHLVS